MIVGVYQWFESSSELRMKNKLSAWLVAWLIDWSTDWLCDYLIDRMIDWLNYSMIDFQITRVITYTQSDSAIDQILVIMLTVVTITKRWRLKPIDKRSVAWWTNDWTMRMGSRRRCESQLPYTISSKFHERLINWLIDWLISLIEVMRYILTSK